MHGAVGGGGGGGLCMFFLFRCLNLFVSSLRNRSALAVNCCVIIYCLEVSCKDQIMSAQRK